MQVRDSSSTTCWKFFPELARIVGISVLIHNRCARVREKGCACVTDDGAVFHPQFAGKSWA
jgi:hypothetical protein